MITLTLYLWSKKYFTWSFNITPLIIKSGSSDCFSSSRSPFLQAESISTISAFFFWQINSASRRSWMSRIHRRRFVMHPCRTFLMFHIHVQIQWSAVTKVLIMTNKSETPRWISIYSIYFLRSLYSISRHEDQQRTSVLMNKRWCSMRNINLPDKFSWSLDLTL